MVPVKLFRDIIVLLLGKAAIGQQEKKQIKMQLIISSARWNYVKLGMLLQQV